MKYRRPVPARRSLAPAAVLCTAAVALTGCSSGGTDAASTPGTTPSAASTATSRTTTTVSSSPATSPKPTTSRTSRTTAAPASCVSRSYAELSPAQRAGQLLMIGLDAGSPMTSDDTQITINHVGNVIYLGGWSGSARIRTTSDHLQSQAGPAATGGVKLLIAADQEGGAVQQLRGAGFTPIVSALQQGAMSAAGRKAYADTIGRQLKAAGVNLNLAPVADTVPRSTAASNAPIGKFNREYGHTPATVGAAVKDVVHGLEEAGVGATVKHFPGLGRITGNTDYTSVGTTDTRTTSTDSYLDPFAGGMRAGASAVMMSSARYAKLDPSGPATFSAKIIDGLLRGKLGWRGVVITDDMNAAAVSGVPVGQRAVRFVAAGGDIVLTGRASDAGTMINALLARARGDKAFAARLKASTLRVLTLKQRLGLLHC